MSQAAASTLFSVVIPAYNEADGIGRVIDRLLAARQSLASAGVCLELIVVDDGSKDGTGAIVQSYPDARLIHHPTNKGYGAALKSGFCAAHGELIGFLDADGTYPPESFPQLCQEALNGADLVVGSRRSGASSEMPLVRRVGNFIWSNLVTLLCSQRVADPASGMRVFRRAVLEQLYPLPNGLNFTPVMSTRAAHEGIRVVEVPIAYRERDGQSKLNVLRDGMRFLETVIWTALTYNPARILGAAGLALLALSMLAAFAILAMRLSGITVMGPWPVASVFFALLFGVAGIDLFALGATFNYLVSLFHARPVRQGVFGKPLFARPLEMHFGWLGLLAMGLGIAAGLGSFAIGIAGWPVERIWLYLTAAAAATLMGMQLSVFWMIMRILKELVERQSLVQMDLTAG